MKTALDMGTGSGCIPIALKKNLPSCEVFACDLSERALLVAKENARLNETEVNFYQKNILNEEEVAAENERKFDVIVSNPPYIKRSESSSLSASVFDHEPHIALFVDGDDDTVFYDRILHFAGRKLNSSGKVYFELNPLSAEKVKKKTKELNFFSRVEIIRDMSGNVRFLRAVR